MLLRVLVTTRGAKERKGAAANSTCHAQTRAGKTD